jgi:hypothetical protein
MVGCAACVIGAAFVLAVCDDRLVDWDGSLRKITVVASHSTVQIKYLAPQLRGHKWQRRVEFLPFTI